MTLQGFLIDLLFYLPPIAAAIFAYGKLKKKYAKPLGEAGTDFRVYVYTLLIGAVVMLVDSLIIYTVVFILLKAGL